jgi:hypothetical protein
MRSHRAWVTSLVAGAGLLALAGGVAFAELDEQQQAIEAGLLQFQSSVQAGKDSGSRVASYFDQDPAKCYALIEQGKPLGIKPSQEMRGNPDKYLFKRASAKCDEYKVWRQLVQAAHYLEGVQTDWGIAKDRVVGDVTVALERTKSITCDAAHDHCVRPWAWFVEDPVKGARVTMFKNGKLHWVFAIDNLVADDDKVAGYRTVPVKPQAVKVGMHVYFRGSLPDTEASANTDWWMYGDVAEVQLEAGVFKIKGDNRHYPLETVRTPVVMWFPGEKAEKYE